MQEIRRTTRLADGSTEESIDRMVGMESPELMRAFRGRRRRLEQQLESGEVESATIREVRRIGRNDPCPCGSNEKFKKCCGARLDPNDARVAD